MNNWDADLQGFIDDFLTLSEIDNDASCYLLCMPVCCTGLCLQPLEFFSICLIFIEYDGRKEQSPSIPRKACCTWWVCTCKNSEPPCAFPISLFLDISILIYLPILSFFFISSLPSLKGDFGFDPLGFTENFQNLRYLQQAELKHARVAMLAIVGFITTQYVHLPGAAYQNVNTWFLFTFVLKWSEALMFIFHFSFLLQSNPIEAIAQVGYGVNLQILFGVGIVELINWENTFSGTTPPGDYGFDGGFLKNKSEKEIATMKLKEIKNGRLAMVGIVGMIWAYLSTGQPTLG